MKIIQCTGDTFNLNKTITTNIKLLTHLKIYVAEIATRVVLLIISVSIIM